MNVMKTIKNITLALILTCFLGSLSSCLIFETTYSTPRHDNGNHNGWYKNPHNPYHHHHKNHGKH